jgi:hypothetical protein
LVMIGILKLKVIFSPHSSIVIPWFKYQRDF